MDKRQASKAKDGGIAVGAYLRYLREKSGLSVKETADALDVDTTMIWRIEGWKSDPRSSTVFRFAALVKGDGNDMILLMNQLEATVEDGERLARLRSNLQQ